MWWRRAADHQEDKTWCPPQLQHEPQPLINSWAVLCSQPAVILITERVKRLSWRQVSTQVWGRLCKTRNPNIYLFLPLLNIWDNYDVSRVREETCSMKRGGSKSEGNTERKERTVMLFWYFMTCGATNQFEEIKVHRQRQRDGNKRKRDGQEGVRRKEKQVRQKRRTLSHSHLILKVTFPSHHRSLELNSERTFNDAITQNVHFMFPQLKVF